MPLVAWHIALRKCFFFATVSSAAAAAKQTAFPMTPSHLSTGLNKHDEPFWHNTWVIRKPTDAERAALTDGCELPYPADAALPDLGRAHWPVIMWHETRKLCFYFKSAGAACTHHCLSNGDVTTHMQGSSSRTTVGGGRNNPGGGWRFRLAKPEEMLAHHGKCDILSLDGRSGKQVGIGRQLDAREIVDEAAFKSLSVLRASQTC